MSITYYTFLEQGRPVRPSAELHRDSPHVRDWWAGHDVRAVGSGVKKLLHPRLGPVDYSHVVLQVADNPDQTLVSYSPGSGSAGSLPGSC
jgi:hypothetical protein